MRFMMLGGSIGGICDIMSDLLWGENTVLPKAVIGLTVVGPSLIPDEIFLVISISKIFYRR